MSDERLRELERRWQESGALADRADYLREQVRFGELEAERLRLAWFLGAPAAALALETTPAPPAPPEIGAWVEAVGTCGLEALRRLAIAAADHAARLSTSSGIPPRALSAAERQVLAPSEEHERAALREAAALRELPDFPMRTPSDVAQAAEQAARAAVASSSQQALSCALSAARAARAALDRWPALPSEPPSERRLQAAIARELLPWALGEADPLRARAAQRGDLLGD